MGAHHHHGHAGHGHHGHGSAAAGNQKRLALTLGLSAVYMLAEAVGGILTGSLALLADAGHMLSDVAALGLSLFAIWIAQRPPSATRTYGYYRTEILAALANGAALVALAVYVLFEAYQRIREPAEVDAPLMMGIAIGGLVVNLIGLRILSGGRSESLNVRGAWLHVFTDMLGSAQAVVAGALIWIYGWAWADPLASVLISLLVIYSSWALLREAVGVLMEGAPKHIDVDDVRNALAGLPGVAGVHDLHVWTITSGREALSAHLVVREEKERQAMLPQIRKVLHDRFGIHHVTVQLETDDCNSGC
ncbi:MAG TPA: cation diffusion facilitator family transporter [Thermoanaerobaculia bacterium]|jgi:cobalt-zinc-cadmium efflux system protein|nr:cation diffusion facilitator family transporter [Thermoanaerobaculia bacterium]